MSEYHFSNCSSFFSACQIGAEIYNKQIYSKINDAWENSYNEQPDIRLDNHLKMYQIQQDLLRLEIAAAMFCHAMRFQDTDSNDNNSFMEAPPEFFASFYHNMIGLDVDWNELLEIADSETLLSLRGIWRSILSNQMQYYRTELQPIFERYDNLLTLTEQIDLNYGIENLRDLSYDGLYYRYSLLCKAAERITVSELNRRFEREGYRGIIADLSNIRNNANNSCVNGSAHSSVMKRSICIAQCSFRGKQTWFCAVSGLWDRSELKAPWTETQKHMPRPLFPQTVYDRQLEKQLDSIIKKLPITTKWCKTAKSIESYFDLYCSHVPLPYPITLLDTLRQVYIQGQQITNWRRLFSCGERKILCHLASQHNNICRVVFYVDRVPCHLCDYSINKVSQHFVTEVKYVP